MRRRHALLISIAAIAILAGVLMLAPAALAAAGGGSAGFGGGGGDGGGGGGGGGAHAFEIYLIFRVLFDVARMGHGLGAIVLVVLAGIYAFIRFALPNLQASARARRQRGAAHRRDTRKRERRVELAAAEASDEDPMFDPDHVRTAAASLFTQIQFAWDAGDRIRLRGLVAPRLLDEWERRLDDFDRKGWHNRVQLLDEPKVEYIGLKHGRGDDGDRVTVRIEARMRDFVTDANGRHLKRRGQFTETSRLREFWTLQRRDDHWILASIEQGAEGSHALEDAIVPTAWSDTQSLTDEAVVEQAIADAAPDGVAPSELISVDWGTDAHAAALDLSLADGRFAPDVLEVAARRAVQAWMEAVDGSMARLMAVADPKAIQDLLHPGDPSGRTRLVVRGAQLRQIKVVGLETTADPPTMTIDVDLRGRRYLEERDTTKVLAGDPARETSFTERWTLALSGDTAEPWRIVAVATAAPTR
jgi:predicted lipid-binding transport protein (Tim44 family)